MLDRSLELIDRGPTLVPAISELDPPGVQFGLVDVRGGAQFEIDQRDNEASSDLSKLI